MPKGNLYGIFKFFFNKTDMIQRNLKYLLCFFLFSFKLLIAQDIKRLEVINVEDGLSQSTIFDIVQDTKGFMWFGTEDGLCKYDGYNFTVFNPIFGDSTSLSDNYIYCIFTDSDKQLWVGTRGGLSKFNYDTNTFINYKEDTSCSTCLQHNYVYTIFEDSKKNLWIGTFGAGLALFNKKTQTFKTFKGDSTDRSGLSQNLIRDIFEDSYGNLWVATDSQGLNLYHPKEEKFTTIKSVAGNAKSLPSNKLYSVTESELMGKYYLWVSSRNGLARLELEKGKSYNSQNTEFFVYQKDTINLENKNCLPNNYIYDIIEDDIGQMWVGTRGGGIAVIDNKEGLYDKFTILNNNPTGQYSISNDHVFKLFEDRSGIIWIGTLKGGINKYVPLKERFKHYPFFKPNPLGNITMSFYEDEQNNLWVGTRGGGISKFRFSETPVAKDYKSSYYKVQQYSHVKRDEFQIAAADVDKFNKNDVYFITKYHFEPDVLLLGTSGGMYLLNKKTGEYKRYRIEGLQTNEFGEFAYTLYPEVFSDKIIYWMGTAKGLAKVIFTTSDNDKPIRKIVSQKLILYSHDPKNKNSISNNTVYEIFKDKKFNELWIGTRGGGLSVLKFNDNESGSDSLAKFESYKRELSIKHSLTHNDVMCIMEDNAGNKWIGTRGGGLVKAVRTSDNKITFIQVSKELSKQVIYGITEDIGYLWLSTSNGLIRYNPVQNTQHRYDLFDGIMRSEFNLGGMFKCRDGKIVFSGINGFNLFFAQNIIKVPFNPNVSIVNFRLFNNTVLPHHNSVLKKDISETKKIILDHSQNFISFEFVVLDYTAQKKNKYSYQLVGFDAHKIECGTRRFADYTNLSPGKYTFKVFATNSDGEWSKEFASIKIVVISPFWYSPFFIIFIFVLVVAIVIGFYKLRVRVIKKQKRLLEIQVQERTQELNAYMNSLKNEVDEHRKTEKALIKAKIDTDKAYRAKSDFLANVSHDIRTPMNTILGFANMIERIVEDSKIKNYVLAIKAGGNSLLLLINDILDLSKIEAGMMKLNNEPISLRSIASELKNIFSLQVIDKGLNMEVQFDDGVPEYLILDELRIRQILFNLISNAIKFTEEGYISLIFKLIGSINEEQNSCHLQITVKDTGSGIPKDQQDGIFEAFVQQKGQQAKRFGGTGLGLAITKQLASLMSGNITLQSEPKKGSSFIIDLFKVQLVKQSDMDKVKREELIDPDLIIFQEAKVLIVDDVSSNRDLLNLMFSGTNIKCSEAENGKEALISALKNKPDVVLLDLLMPEMDGFEAIARFKTNSNLRHIPVIAITASVTNETKEKVSKERFDGFIPKPINRAELFMALTKFIKHQIVVATPNAQTENSSNKIQPTQLSKEAYQILQTKIMKLWQDSESSNSIAKIKEFNDSLIAFINNYNVANLSKFSIEFNNNTQAFDIEKIEIMLKNFPSLIESFSVE